MKVILGVDPGSIKTGYAFIGVSEREIKVLDLGVIKPISGEFVLRLNEIGTGLKKLLNERHPVTMVVEKIFLGKNADSAFKLGHARGVILYEAGQLNIPVVEYATREIKKGISGSGAADKEIIRSILLNTFKIKGEPGLDATDALALAVYHGQRLDVFEKFRKQGIEL